MTTDAKHTILIVEDDTSLRDGIQDLLELEENVEIFCVSNGVEALDALQTHTPSLIISDIMMPQMDGFELLSAVRNDPRLLTVPFIFLSARGSHEEVFRGRKSGAEMYITKPFVPTELINFVKMQLQRADERQIASQNDISSLKSNVLQILNHEFRTPLTYVTAYYEMLADTITKQPDGRNLDEYLNGILTGCERLIDLIEDLILVMDIRSGTLAETFRTKASPVTNFDSLIKIAMEAYRPLAQKNNINIEFAALPNKNPVVWGSEEQLLVLLKHLIENAVKFTTYTAQKSGTGHITLNLSVGAENDWVHFEVIDTGIGIPADAKQKVFELFYQHNRHYYEQQGSGSGLPIALGIVDIYGGKLLIDSEEGAGSRVLLRLPLYKGGDAPNPADAHKQVKPLAKVLLVEDDEDIRASMEDLIAFHKGKYRLQVESAEDGSEALKKLEGFKPDIILSDLMMPKLDGYGLLKQVRQRPDLLNVPFMIITAKDGQKDIYDGRVSGAEEYITKPFDPFEMIALIEARLDRYFEYKQVADQDFDDFKQNILSMLQPEFRTPLQSVSQSSNLLTGEQEKINTAEDLRHTLATIQTGSVKISELVEDFMSLAEIETGEAQKAFDNRGELCTYFDYLVSEAIAYHRETFEAHSIVPKMVIENGENGARIESSIMERALIRLIGIATAFCIESNGSELTIEVGRGMANDLTITVWHNGDRLNAEATKKIELIMSCADTEGRNDLDLSSHFKIVAGFVGIQGGRFAFVPAADEARLTGRNRFVISLPLIEPSPKASTNEPSFMLGN